MDRNIEVRTPESIAFAYELAGLGSRFLAVMVDLIIQGVLIIALFMALAAAASRLQGQPQSSFVTNVGLGIFFFIIFAILFGYFIVLEAVWNGQTPGKKLLGIRVVRDGGYAIDLSASLVRNLIRVGEASLGFYVISAISALLSTENKRIGDFAAGTIVVRDARLPTPEALARDFVQEPVYAPTSLLSGEERALIHRFIERRDTLTPQRRATLASQLVARVRPRVPPDLARLDDESLLEKL